MLGHTLPCELSSSPASCYPLCPVGNWVSPGRLRAPCWQGPVLHFAACLSHGRLRLFAK